MTTASQDLTSFLDANSSNIIQLNAASVATLQILARYSPEFPCALKDLANFVPAADKLLGKGTNQPGLHVQMIVVPPLGPHHIGRYVAGKDTPVYGDNLGPHCYPIPFPGITLNDGAAPSNPASGPASTPARPRSPARHAARRAPRPRHGARGQAGAHHGGPGPLAGSPTESELVRELTGMALGRSPSLIPDWGSLLTAPLFRGATVSLRTRA